MFRVIWLKPKKQSNKTKKIVGAAVPRACPVSVSEQSVLNYKLYYFSPFGSAGNHKGLPLHLAFTISLWSLKRRN
jgi:hypothetical protein